MLFCISPPSPRQFCIRYTTSRTIRTPRRMRPGPEAMGTPHRFPKEGIRGCALCWSHLGAVEMSVRFRVLFQLFFLICSLAFPFHLYQICFGRLLPPRRGCSHFTAQNAIMPPQSWPMVRQCHFGPDKLPLRDELASPSNKDPPKTMSGTHFGPSGDDSSLGH